MKCAVICHCHLGPTSETTLPLETLHLKKKKKEIGVLFYIYKCKIIYVKFEFS